MTDREMLETLRDKVEVYVDLVEMIDAHHDGRNQQTPEQFAQLLQARDAAQQAYRQAFEDSIEGH